MNDSNENNRTVRVRITKCGNPNYWYAKCIGVEFNVEQHRNYPECWYCIFSEQPIEKSDCEVISAPTDKCPICGKDKLISATISDGNLCTCTPTDKKTTAEEFLKNYIEPENAIVITRESAKLAMEDFATLRLTELLSKAGDDLPDAPMFCSLDFKDGSTWRKEKYSAIIAGKEQQHKQEIEIMKESIDDVVDQNIAMKRLIKKFNDFLDTFGTVFPGGSDEKEALMQRELFDEARKYINH